MTTLRRQIQVFTDEHLSQAARSKSLADLAQNYVNNLVSKGQASPNYRRIVDGVEGAPPDTVKRGGIIQYEFSYIAEVIVFALAFLKTRAPASGNWPKAKRYPRAYRDCFMVAVNGRPIAAAAFQPRSVPLDAEIYIWNSQPYSRKIDVQRAGKRSLTFSVPAGLFDDAARAIRRRFGNTVTAARKYDLNFPGKYVTRTGPVQSPALLINPVA